MSYIIGREKEIRELHDLYNSGNAEFVAIYGRRRVGKTFLVDEALKGKITFRHAGLSPVDEQNRKNNLKAQLTHFFFSLQMQGMKGGKSPLSWMEAFYMLEQLLEKKSKDNKRQVVFIDELPWLDTPRSGFMTAFEGFWNTWGCHRDNLMLVVCGSASSWMLDNLINNHGGLYGRTTYEIKLHPFTLTECEEYFRGKGILFADGAKLHDEYDRLFASVFSNPEQMKRIVQLLAGRRLGFTRKDILSKTGLDDCGPSTRMLKALEMSDFIRPYVPFGKSLREVYYKLIDPFCLFYLKFVHTRKEMDPEFWMHNVTSASINSWRGFAFEEICFNHVDKIKKALNILGVSSRQSGWAVIGDDDTEGGQIDLLIERKDNVVNMCEMKFYSELITISKAYHAKLVHRQNLLMKNLSRKTVVQPVLVTTEGLVYNEYSGIFQNVVVIDNLF